MLVNDFVKNDIVQFEPEQRIAIHISEYQVAEHQGSLKEIAWAPLIGDFGALFLPQR
jgi:hypothetical protein